MIYLTVIDMFVVNKIIKTVKIIWKENIDYDLNYLRKKRLF